MILLSDLSKEILAVCPIYGLSLNDDGSVYVEYDPAALPAQVADAENLLATNSGQIGFDFPQGPVTSGSITGNMIADHAITAGKIAPGSLSADMFTSGSIGIYTLSSGSIVGDNIAEGQIHTYHLASGNYVGTTVNNPTINSVITSMTSGSNGLQGNDSFTYDGTTLTLNSTVSGSTVMSINGHNGNILQVNDEPYGQHLLEVANNYSGTLFAVSAAGYIKNWSALFSGQQGFFTAFSVDMNAANSAVIDYYVRNTEDSSSRAGTLNLVWDESLQVIDYNEYSTNNIGGSMTDNLYFSADIILGQTVLQANISSGTWNGRIGARVL
jgi:hypothetical protein